MHPAKTARRVAAGQATQVSRRTWLATAAISVRDTLYCDAGVFAAAALIISFMSPVTRTEPRN